MNRYFVFYRGKDVGKCKMQKNRKVHFFFNQVFVPEKKTRKSRNRQERCHVNHQNTKYLLNSWTSWRSLITAVCRKIEKLLNQLLISALFLRKTNTLTNNITIKKILLYFILLYNSQNIGRGCPEACSGGFYFANTDLLYDIIHTYTQRTAQTRCLMIQAAANLLRGRLPGCGWPRGTHRQEESWRQTKTDRPPYTTLPLPPVLCCCVLCVVFCCWSVMPRIYFIFS